MLYDKAFIDKLPKLVQFENPWIVTICTMPVHKELRGLIEKWYSNIPEGQQSKLYTKLRSSKNELFIPAFYELVIHQFCVEEGWNVEYEPPIPSGGTPDLLVTTKSGEKFILDATSLFDSEDFVKANRRKQTLTQKISCIDTEFVLELYYLKLPDASARPKAIQASIIKWLSLLPNDSKRHTKTFHEAGYEIKVAASKSSTRPSKGCISLVSDPVMSTPDYSDRIKSTLNDKRQSYSSKKTNLPLVVMVCDAVGLIRADENAIDKTLFGRHQMVFNASNSGPAEFGRDRSGYFTPSNDASGEWQGKNTGLSAVMYVSLKEKGSFQMQLFHNPLPEKALSLLPFQKMPQLTPFSIKPDITMRWVVINPQEQRIHFF